MLQVVGVQRGMVAAEAVVVQRMTVTVVQRMVMMVAVVV